MFEATVRYNNFNDNEVLDTVPSYYDSLLVAGKMVAHSTKAVPARLQQLSDNYGIEYYVDPTLPDFRIGDDFQKNGRIKEWHWKYIDRLDPVLKELLSKRKNVDASGIDPNDRELIARSAVRFQENAVVEAIEDGGTSKYASSIDPTDYQPKAVVPWYHKIDSSPDLEVNEHIIEVSNDESELPLKPCLFLTKPFVRRSSNQPELTHLLVSKDIDQCFIWIEGLDKKDTDQSLYERIIEFVQSLADEGISSHFYYADYFTTLISYFGLQGATYGTMHAENASEKEGGQPSGGALSRYYIDPIKDFLKIPAAVELQKSVGASMCECEVCQRQFDDWDDLARRENADEENIQAPIKKHHLILRWNQIRSVEDQTLEETIDACRDGFERYVEQYNAAAQISPKKSIDYLPRWINAAEKLS